MVADGRMTVYVTTMDFLQFIDACWAWRMTALIYQWRHKRGEARMHTNSPPPTETMHRSWQSRKPLTDNPSTQSGVTSAQLSHTPASPSSKLQKKKVAQGVPLVHFVGLVGLIASPQHSLPIMVATDPCCSGGILSNIVFTSLHVGAWFAPSSSIVASLPSSSASM